MNISFFGGEVIIFRRKINISKKDVSNLRHVLQPGFDPQVPSFQVINLNFLSPDMIVIFSCGSLGTMIIIVYVSKMNNESVTSPV